MPVTKETVHTHRQKTTDWASNFHPAMVHRKVNKAEIRQKPTAQQALDTERKKFEAVPVWDKDNPKSWPEIAKQAINAGKHVYVGNWLELVTQRHSEFADGDPLKKYK